MEGVWLTRSTSVARCIVAMATCVIANLRCSKTKLSSVAESSRGVNHYLQTHTDAWRHEATAGTDQSLRATLWCDQMRDVHRCRGHLNIRHLLPYLLALFIEEQEKPVFPLLLLRLKVNDSDVDFSGWNCGFESGYSAALKYWADWEPFKHPAPDDMNSIPGVGL